MGWDERKVTITARVSRHNSPQDRLDDAYWNLLVEMVRKVLDDVNFASIQAEIDHTPVTRAGPAGAALSGRTLKENT